MRSLRFSNLVIFAVSSFCGLATLTTATTTGFNPTYDDPNQSLTSVACSDGPNGLITRGFTTFGSFPGFPNIGGAPAVQGWNSIACGTCWQLTYTTTQSGGTAVQSTINILAIDRAGPDSFNIAEGALDTLTGGKASQLGRVNVTSVQVGATNCGF